MQKFNNIENKNLSVKYIISLILIVLSCFLFIYYSLKNIETISLPFLNGIYDEIDINIEIPQNLKKVIIVNNGIENINLETQSINKNPTDIKNYNVSFNKKSKYIAITLPAEYEKSFLTSVVTANITMGKDFFYFSNRDINNFKKNEFNNNGTKFLKIYFPDNITKIKNNKYINYKGNFNLLVITFLSFFYCLKIYTLPWLILFLGLILIPKNKIKINPYIYLAFILFIGFSVRLNQYDAYGLWWDELYVAMQTLNGYGVYFDATNPPIFPLFAKIQTLILSDFSYSQRLLTIMLGSCAIISLFLLIKNYVNKNGALLSSFILSISIYAIAYSQEYRSYAVLMFLSPIIAYSFIKMLKEKSNKSYIIYGILGAIFINTHLYSSIFLLANGIYGLYSEIQELIPKKLKIKNIIKFVCVNLFILITFLPFIFHKFINWAILNPFCNIWIPKISKESLTSIINANFGNITLFIIYLIICLSFIVIVKKLNNKINYYPELSNTTKDFIYYIIYIISFVFIFSIIVSLIRPISVEHYYLIIYPLIIGLISSIICQKRKFKQITVILLLFSLFYISAQTNSNDFKSERNYTFFSNIVNQQAKIHPDKIIVELLEPNEYSHFLHKYLNNVYIEDRYNIFAYYDINLINIIKKYKEENKEFIVSVIEAELLKESDKEAINSESFPYRTDRIKMPKSSSYILNIFVK